MKFSTEINRLPTAYNADAQSAARALSRLDFQQVLKEAKAQLPSTTVTQPAVAPRSTTTASTATSPPPLLATAAKIATRFPERFSEVKSGDTLVSIAQKALQARGFDASPQAAMRAALQLAKENGLPNPNLIVPGQRITVNSLTGIAPPALLASINAGSSRTEGPSKSPVSTTSTETKLDPIVTQKITHPILEKTLDRAVNLQYFSAAEKDAVRSKILDLAAEHHFSPDDLAVVTLIESDGMNPKASNGRCHGVIQFCDGSNRGAATVGFKNNPKAILDLPVIEQLDLVGKYFDETGLKHFGKSKPASLDDLYLTVLTPAARSERNMNAYLDIAGQQANILKTNSEPSAHITRKTLLQGLRQNARDKLSMTTPAPNHSNVQGTNAFQKKNTKTELIKVSSANDVINKTHP